MQAAGDDRGERYVAARRAESERLLDELAGLNARLGEARVRQERMQRPSTLITERLPERLAVLSERVRARVRRR